MDSGSNSHGGGRWGGRRLTQPSLQIKVGVNTAIKQCSIRDANGAARRGRAAHLPCKHNLIYKPNLI